MEDTNGLPARYTTGRRQPFEDPAELARYQTAVEGQRPLQVEIGSGKGLFLRSAAASDRQTQWVGIEIARKFASRSDAKLRESGLENAMILCGDGVLALDQLTPAGRLDALHVYFPDPWWKARHKKRRVLNETLLLAANRAIKSGGKFHFWTDVLDYYDATLDLIGTTVDWSGPEIPSERPAEHDLDYLTHFERRSRLGGLPVYRAAYTIR